MSRIQSSARSQQSAVINHQSSSAHSISHPPLTVSPQYQLSPRSISCQPTASAVTAQHQLSAHSIRCQPTAPATSLQHQLSTISCQATASASTHNISRQSAASTINPQHQLSAIISRPQSSSTSYQLPTSNHHSSAINNQAAINHHLQPANY